MKYNFETSETEARNVAKSAFEKAIEKGIEKGMEKGMEKEKLATAINMLQLGLDVDIIRKITRLPIEQIKRLKSE